jgi:L-2-hydroxycarboxylate dehydrogenase (NAD+)
VTTAASIAATEIVVVDAEDLRQAILDALVAHGATPSDARQQATILVEGDLRDHHSHGVRRLPVLVSRLDNGLISSGVEPNFDWVTESVLQVDGQRGFGPSVAFAAIDRIIERAETTGLAVAAISNSNHVGMLAPYIEKISDSGQIAFGFTTSEALVHPWGGAQAMVGTNPIGIGMPTGELPLVLDMSTASVSMGKILDHAAKGEPIPLGWAVDANGAPTEDAQAAVDGGAISPFGGPKGYALGIALEVVIATLTKTSVGTHVRGTLDTTDASSKGDVFIAISLERLGLTDYLPRIRDYLDEVRASNNGAVSIPGDRARATRERRSSEGIPLHRQSWERALALKEVGSSDV